MVSKSITIVSDYKGFAVFELSDSLDFYSDGILSLY